MEQHEQFSLSWNNFHSNLSSGFQTLLQDEDLVDCTLAAEGRYLKAHKVVLSVCSSYFKELFRANPCKHPIVILQDVNYEALRNLLAFMYQGEVSVNQEDIPTFMKVAEVLKIKGLTETKTDNTVEMSKHLKMEENGMMAGNEDEKDIKPQLSRKTKPFKRSVQPPQKIPRLDDTAAATTTQPMMKLIQPKSEPIDDPPDEPPMDEPAPIDYLNNHFISHDHRPDTTASSSSLDSLPNSCNSFAMKGTDATSPGTLQCIVGKRGLPRLIVDGHTFFRKSTYKNKCFWYCKTNRAYKCPAVCWTVNGRIVKWPEAHTHEIFPELITPGEDTIVPVEMLRQVLIDAAK